MQPLSTVDSPGFVNLIKGLCGANVQIPCVKTLKKNINTRFEKCMYALKAKLASQKYVCTTADLWSCHNKSYIGVTCHTIKDNFSRESFVLGFERVKGSHTYIIVGTRMYEIHSRYNLVQANKINHTVTDNASNFGEAFRIFEESDEDLDADDEVDDNFEIDTPAIDLLSDNLDTGEIDIT